MCRSVTAEHITRQKCSYVTVEHATRQMCSYVTVVRYPNKFEQNKETYQESFNEIIIAISFNYTIN